jgi:hypothetical protein
LLNFIVGWMISAIALEETRVQSHKYALVLLLSALLQLSQLNRHC